MANPENIESQLKTDDGFADPPMLIRSVSANGFFRTNASFRARVGFSDAALAGEPFLHWIDPAGMDAVRETIEGRHASCRIAHKTQSGDPLPMDIQVDEYEGEPIILARCAVEAAAKEGPKDIDDEATVRGTLHTIAQIVEDQNPGYKCSILLVADGKFVRGAGPSLPEDYNAAIDGSAVGPTIGSCGTAICWNVPIIVEDIQADPLWAPFAPLAQQAGVAACWSHPFASSNGRVLGALALYSPVPRAPTPEQLGRLKAAARMTGLAVERGRAEEALRAKRQRELELEDQLRQAAKMEALGVLTGGVAHDFNNVLLTILSNAELSLDLLEPGTEVRKMLSAIVDASKRAGRFCQQMLAYAGRGTLKTSRVEIGSLIPELSSLVQVAVSKKTNLEYALIDQPVFVEGDENQLLQVIMNLVTNAAEAIGEDEGLIVVKTELVNYDEEALRSLDPQSDLPPGEYLHLSVQDDGAGMDAETLSRIFDPFFTTKFTGRGLGLSAVKGIVSQHGGAIKIDSKAGKGTTFTVVLPTSERVHRAKKTDAPPPPDTGQKCVLIADDEKSIRDVLCLQLKHAGFKVLTASDGRQAIDVFSEHHESIDCVLLDFSMPKCSGKEAQQALHAIRAEIPIILMSGFSEQKVVDRFRDTRIAGSLQKPFSAREMLKAIRNAITGGPAAPRT